MLQSNIALIGVTPRIVTTGLDPVVYGDSRRRNLVR
jgi:hypothetical protein